MKKFLKMLRTCITTCQINAQTQIDASTPVPGQWSVEKINNWYNDQPWLVGCNYYPATAINQIEMWQASTWDPKTIDKELGWAESIGMNTLRVYLYALVWADDPEGLYTRMDEFLNICQKHHIRPFFVFFDDCHYSNPKLGPQPLPVKCWHNSGWVNCPAKDLVLRYADRKVTNDEKNQLKGYVQKIMVHFKDDERILMWELYNEPGRVGKGEKSNKLVYDSWVWAREINPSQPITSTTEGSVGDRNIKINRINSDLHSIHAYAPVSHLLKLIGKYKKDNRPIIVTEWLAREFESTVETYLPAMKEQNVGAVNWGFVSGKSGTVWPWSSRKIHKDANGNNLTVSDMREKGEVIEPGEPFPEPEIWFHDLFRMDGTPYDENEIKLFRSLTGK